MSLHKNVHEWAHGWVHGWVFKSDHITSSHTYNRAKYQHLIYQTAQNTARAQGKQLGCLYQCHAIPEFSVSWNNDLRVSHICFSVISKIFLLSRSTTSSHPLIDDSHEHLAAPWSRWIHGSAPLGLFPHGYCSGSDSELHISRIALWSAFVGCPWSSGHRRLLEVNIRFPLF